MTTTQFADALARKMHNAAQWGGEDAARDTLETILQSLTVSPRTLTVLTARTMSAYRAEHA